MTIERRDHKRGHSYYVDGVKLPGVTTIIGATVPKPALIDWAARVTAEHAVDFWDELTELTMSDRLQRLKGVRFETSDAAAKRGTEVHRLAEGLVAGEEVAKPDELAGHIESYVDFLNEMQPSAVLVEAVVANLKVGYCGTVDLIADINGTRWLLDLKTAKGIYAETALQCCAYFHAETISYGQGNERPLADVGIERVGVVHVRADGWDLHPLRADDAVWDYFRHLAWLYKRAGEQDEWVGPAIAAPRAVAS